MREDGLTVSYLNAGLCIHMSDLLVRVHVEFQLIERRIRIRTLRTEVAAVAGHLKR